MQTPDISPDSADTERPHSEFAHRSWPADVHQLPAIREDVRGWLKPLELTEGARQDLVLAVSEAASNALAHAYPEPSGPSGRDTVEMTYWIDDGRVWIEIVDRGAWKTPKDSADGHGLGIPMMQRLVDSVMIHYGARGTSVLMSHPLPGEARAVPDYPGHPVRLRVTDSVQPPECVPRARTETESDSATASDARGCRRDRGRRATDGGARPDGVN
jgi:anti-sigma regulatory factor (Ser/Thr protein kinase)